MAVGAWKVTSFEFLTNRWIRNTDTQSRPHAFSFGRFSLDIVGIFCAEAISRPISYAFYFPSGKVVNESFSKRGNILKKLIILSIDPAGDDGSE